MKIFFSIVILLGFLGLGFMHEQVHIAIWDNYGIESHIEYFSHFPHLVTVANGSCPTEECILAHNINEIVGYPLMVLYIVFGVGLLILIKIGELKLEYCRNCETKQEESTNKKQVAYLS